MSLGGMDVVCKSEQIGWSNANANHVVRIFAQPMDKSSHLSVILDLSPKQWHLSSLQPENEYPLSLQSFLSQLLAFLNSHIACKHENTLAVFGALPGKR